MLLDIVMTALYHCNCQEPSDATDVEDYIPQTLYARTSLWDLEWLYFCEQCRTVRCPLCVREQVVTWYCTTCNYEVIEADARRGLNKCLRNCLVCRKCSANMILEAEGEMYKAKCAHCGWKCKELLKNKPTAYFVLHSIRRANRKKLDRLREAVRDGMERPQPEASLESKEQEKESTQVEEEQQQQLPEYPLLRPLRGKSIKSCRGCAGTLLKPDTAPTSTRYKVWQMAMMYLPQLRLHTGPKLEPGIPTTLCLTVTNPLQRPIHVRLAAAANPSTAGLSQPDPLLLPKSVTLVTPELDLGPSSQLLDEETLVRGVPQSRVSHKSATARRVYMETRPQTAVPGGPVETGPNWATIELEVVPQSPDMLLALFVSHEHADSDDPGIGSWAVLSIGNAVPVP